MTTDITELARRVEHIISDMKLKHGDKDTYAPVMKWDEFLALVEALEKAQGMEAYWKTQCRGITDHCEELQARIAELEESNAQVIQSRDHYKRMTEEGLKQLAEARTVKLPDLRQIVSGDRYVWSDGVYNYSQDVKVVLAAAGIKVEAE
ncbi:TPA: hypothetical protein QII12_001498 [Klebsiella pneumoniae subsp. pneumoniae]|nr:hypothetical protein [Klebsiella pneumoniae]HEO9559175.1 hypothetical protein [Klebsiella pneumoniae subsp. pneumoniae]MBT1554365.1 hypothetical protein [Klebsiella pneumoniae]MBT1560973.1 hypothetical protein [Klebsiella pneumoniae]MBT1564901.1 hypothetical protein [Klebsiella pneumoniae]MBT1591069.1 hypothetical protein [Klebsiella pneumoniae]